MHDKREFAALYYSGGPEVCIALLTKGEQIVEHTLDCNENHEHVGGRESAGEFLGTSDCEKVDDPHISGLRIYEVAEPTWNDEDEGEDGYWTWDNGIVRMPTAEELAEIMAGVWCPVW
jgi:hypothetical protein